MKSGPSVITLFGREEENFYHLGTRDRNGFLQCYHSLQHGLGSSPALLKVVSEIVAQTAKLLFSRHGQLKRNLEAYSEGMQLPLEQVYGGFLLPEIFASKSFFMPNLIGTFLGCSSLFFKESGDSGISHFRLLDFPLVEAYPQYQQTVLMKFPRQKVFFFTTQGMPYPGITAMNESGLTMALHQKNNKFFQYSGTPILELAKLVISEARDRKDIEDIIKENPSMSGWGIYSCLKDEVLAIDILGEKYWIKSYPLEPGQTLYFCNECPEHSAFQDVITFGGDEYNRMRRESIEEYLVKKESLNEDTILKGLSKPLGRKGSSAAKWRQSPLALNTIDSCLLNPLQRRALRVRGPAPKNFHQGYQTFQQCFTEPKVKIYKKRPEKRFQRYLQGQAHFSRVTHYYQERKIHALFHSLQMAEEYYQGWPEHYIVRFYHIVFQYILLKSARDEYVLLSEFEKLQGKLPSYLDQQCKLFILRLHKLLELDIPGLALEHPQLQKIWAREVRFRSVILRAQRFLYMPRPANLDIIYPFVSN